MSGSVQGAWLAPAPQPPCKRSLLGFICNTTNTTSNEYKMYSTSNPNDINNIHLQVSMINKNKTNFQQKTQCSCYIFCRLIFMSAQKNWPESHISQSDTEIGDRLIHVYAYFTQSIHVYAYFVHSLLKSTATFFRS